MRLREIFLVTVGFGFLCMILACGGVADPAVSTSTDTKPAASPSNSGSTDVSPSNQTASNQNGSTRATQQRQPSEPAEKFEFVPKSNYVNATISEAKRLKNLEPNLPLKRVWTTRDGDFERECEFVKYNAGKVTFANDKGKEVSMTLGKLSKEDVEYVKKLDKFLNDRKAFLDTNFGTYDEIIERETKSMRDRDELEQQQAFAAKQREKAERARIASLNVTMTGFNSVEMNMTYKQVVEIIGWADEKLSEVEIMDINFQMLVWTQPGTWGGNCNITFENGRVVAKAQAGLR